jgi:hypothetical protein
MFLLFSAQQQVTEFYVLLTNFGVFYSNNYEITTRNQASAFRIANNKYAILSIICGNDIRRFNND